MDFERCAECASTHLIDRTLALPTEKCILLIGCSNSNDFIEAGACYICDANCSECNSRQTCKTCDAGYFLNEAKKCSACTDNCGVCTSATSCTQCLNDGYIIYSSDNIFSGCSVSCIRGVTQCDFSHHCYTCPAGCDTCEFDANKNIVCLTCTNAQHIIKLGRCVSYDKGYIYSTGICVPCTGGICTSCPVGYYISSGNCVVCAANCKTCTSDICINCVDGYYQLTPLSDECSRCIQPDN